MDKNKQQIAIAKACGWRLTETDITYPNGLKIGYHPPEYVREVFSKIVPDYLNDLNAMHEAEKTIRPKDTPTPHGWEKWDEYEKRLSDLCGDDHATAAQRAEAFLKTLNLWEE